MEQITLPDEIEQLTEAVIGGIDAADCYVEKEGGGFVLSDAARRQIAACNEDLAKLEAEANAKLAEADAKITRLNGRTRELAASGAIREALLDRGVKAKAASMALPYLTKALKIEVDDSFAATVNGQSVESAVATWLESEAGCAFAPKRSTPGPLASAIREMRRAH